MHLKGFNFKFSISVFNFSFQFQFQLAGLGAMLDITHVMLDIPQLQQHPLKYGFSGIYIYIYT